MPLSYSRFNSIIFTRDLEYLIDRCDFVYKSTLETNTTNLGEPSLGLMFINITRKNRVMSYSLSHNNKDNIIGI